MQKRVIDNKFVLMTNEEWYAYQDICKSYDNPPRVRGSDLFTGLFESDNDGIITFIHPPSVRQTSMEVWLFVSALFQHQHMRLIESQAKQLFDEFRAKSEKMLEEIRAEVLKTLSKKDIGNNSSST
jgi:hypothetical protein